jgi:hypothetical protein
MLAEHGADWQHSLDGRRHRVSSDIATSIPSGDARRRTARQSWRFVRPRLAAGGEPDGRASLLGEVAVAFAVLLAAAILTNAAPPPVDAASATPRSAR